MQQRSEAQASTESCLFDSNLLVPIEFGTCAAKHDVAAIEVHHAVAEHTLPMAFYARHLFEGTQSDVGGERLALRRVVIVIGRAQIVLRPNRRLTRPVASRTRRRLRRAAPPRQRLGRRRHRI